MIINTPNNPTGVIYSEETLRAMAGILEEKEREFGHPIVLISDEPYRELAYDMTVVAPCYDVQQKHLSALLPTATSLFPEDGLAICSSRTRDGGEPSSQRRLSQTVCWAVSMLRL